MIDIELVIRQRPDLFESLALRWHRATAGELALLSPSGRIIDAYNGASSDLMSAINIAENGEISITPCTNAIITPMLVHGEVKGYLLSYNSAENQFPMLAWASEILLDHLNSEQALQSMTDELIVAWDQLELLYRITQTLGEHTNLSNVLTSTLEEIIKVVTVEIAFIIYNYQGRFNCVIAGPSSLPDAAISPDLLNRLANLNQLILYNSRSLTLDVWPDAPQTLYNFIGASIPTSGDTVAALGLINNTNKNIPTDFAAGHAKLITSVSEQIGPIFDYFNLQEKIIAQERLRHELEIAAEIQESLMPGNPPKVNGVIIDVITLPAYEVGGDFYDFIRINEHQLTVVLGDVAGKGIPAAMVTSMIRTMLRVEALHNQEPHIIIQQANEVLQEDLGRADLFVTAFVATLDTKANVLMYANAGHVPGIIYHAQAKKSRLLKATSLPIGISGYNHETFKPTQYVHIGRGDTLVIFSDGVFEAIAPNGEQFGIQTIRDLIHRHADESPDRLKAIILEHVAAFRQTEHRADDVTLSIIKFSTESHRPKHIKLRKVLDTLSFKYVADTVHLTDISETVTRACRRLRNLPLEAKGDDFVYLVELAVSEICTNIIEHAYADDGGYITGQLTLTNLGIEIDVYDQGKGFNPNEVPPPISDPMDPTEGGYGLHIVRQIMDIADYSVDTPRGNHWKLVKYLPE